jgi:hypothetical protein
VVVLAVVLLEALADLPTQEQVEAVLTTLVVPVAIQALLEPTVLVAVDLTLAAVLVVLVLTGSLAVHLPVLAVAAVPASESKQHPTLAVLTAAALVVVTLRSVASAGLGFCIRSLQIFRKSSCPHPRANTSASSISITSRPTIRLCRSRGCRSTRS